MVRYFRTKSSAKGKITELYFGREKDGLDGLSVLLLLKFPAAYLSGNIIIIIFFKLVFIFYSLPFKVNNRLTTIHLLKKNWKQNYLTPKKLNLNAKRCVFWAFTSFFLLSRASTSTITLLWWSTYKLNVSKSGMSRIFSTKTLRKQRHIE